MSKPKDAVIVDTVNPDKKGTLSVRELKRRLKTLGPLLEEAQDKKEASGKNSKENSEDVLTENSWAYMLKDMRKAYKEAGGKTKLLKLIKDDDKMLMAMVRELMKVEASLMATELRNKDNNPGEKPVVFVILKGLHDEEALLKTKEDDVVDLAQVNESLNPNATKKITLEEDMLIPR